MPCSRSRSRCASAPQRYLDDPTLVRNIIEDGCEKARKLAQETLRDVKRGHGPELQLNAANGQCAAVLAAPFERTVTRRSTRAVLPTLYNATCQHRLTRAVAIWPCPDAAAASPSRQAISPLNSSNFRCDARRKDDHDRAGGAAADREGLRRALLEMPHDLYIPPDALEVFLDQFEGPLDLLLYLIRKENINVLDIPMARLTRQYLEYVELMRRPILELAAEYLLMAAMLIEIKSRMLLPRPAAGDARGGPARGAGAPPGRVRADEARRAAPRRAAPARARFLASCRCCSSSRRRAAAGGARRRPARGLAHAAARARREPASPHHARAAVGARAHEPASCAACTRRVSSSSSSCSIRSRASRRWS